MTKVVLSQERPPRLRDFRLNVEKTQPRTAGADTGGWIGWISTPLFEVKGFFSVK